MSGQFQKTMHNNLLLQPFLGTENLRNSGWRQKLKVDGWRKKWMETFSSLFKCTEITVKGNRNMNSEPPSLFYKFL